ncbi:sugar transferase [Bradyrhizobium prioriisuperbiae]|uniref:sugar transferase n=1 Tax=Bradyrhizobium prioriisuperbiae TaxID=2854389 RepID=UPI0028EF4977|nr:sugar transferase [Bradyrhizobium prioritasuperba]
MDLIALIAVAVLGILGATLSKLLSDEFKAWAPSITSGVIKIAVRQLPADKRERFTEEWSSHVNDIPGDISKLVVALGFVLASWRMSSTLFDTPKRVLDVFLAAITALVLFPFLVLVAIAIRLESPGPVFFLQLRAGRGGRLFKVIKFRTMQPLKDDQPVSERVTRIGRWLRRFNIDEIPQLINILRGDMSFVGPRALPPSLTQPSSEPNDVKPGLSVAAKIYIEREFNHVRNLLTVRLNAARKFLRKMLSSRARCFLTESGFPREGVSDSKYMLGSGARVYDATLLGRPSGTSSGASGCRRDGAINCCGSADQPILRDQMEESEA